MPAKSTGSRSASARSARPPGKRSFPGTRLPPGPGRPVNGSPAAGGPIQETFQCQLNAVNELELHDLDIHDLDIHDPAKQTLLQKIGRASCRERVCQYV